MPPAKKLPADPQQSARVAGLEYVSGDGPGIKRLPSGKSWKYRDVRDRIIRGTEELSRIQSLVIPPAWRDVWICPNPDGHLQAVGIDVRGRKQYRYHPRFRAVRDATKFARMPAFGAALPRIRRCVARDLSLPGLPKQKVLAAIVRLLESTSIRVGNEEYARTNDSFGLTTLSDKHVQFAGSKLSFHFKGKSGVEHRVTLRDARLARIVRNCQEIPGQDLFQYIDEDGNRCKIRSEDVNAYIRGIAGDEFTAKDFRTWNGTCEALAAFRAVGLAQSVAAAKKNVVQAVKQVALVLGNRPATCRKYYIHPVLTEAYLKGHPLAPLSAAKKRHLSADEVFVLAMVG